MQWTFALISIPALELIQAGIEKAGSLDRNAVFNAIKSNEFPTVMGPFKAGEKGVGSLNPFPVQVQKGQLVAIWPPEAKTGNYIYPRCYTTSRAAMESATERMQAEGWGDNEFYAVDADEKEWACQAVWGPQKETNANAD